MLKTGKYLESISDQCQVCPVNTINPGNCVDCIPCSLLHYTSNMEHTCIPCPPGTLRQASSGFKTCMPCPRFFFASQETQQCEPCVLQDSFSCDKPFFLNDCSTPGGVCGCSPCSLYVFEGTVPNFRVLSRCQAGCDNGYKLESTSPNIDASRHPLQCVSNSAIMLRPPYAKVNQGEFKLRYVNSSDTTLVLCYDFFSLSVTEIHNRLHMKPCSRKHHARVPILSSLLTGFIKDPLELEDMDIFCSFCCADGFFAMTSLDGNITECIAKNLQGDCLLPTYTHEQCTVSRLHGVY